MMNTSKAVAYCALIALSALYAVGFVNSEVLRHSVQTLPLWFPIAMGWRNRETAKWAAVPCFIIWLMLMCVIWLFLLGWTNIISGHFSGIEIALTLVIGGSCIVGTIVALRWRTRVNWVKGLSMAALFAIFQMVALRLSFLPSIAKDPIILFGQS